MLEDLVMLEQQAARAQRLLGVVGQLPRAFYPMRLQQPFLKHKVALALLRLPVSPVLQQVCFI
jgi:hypothetical protein